MFGRVKSGAAFAVVLGAMTIVVPTASAGLLNDVGQGVDRTVRDLNDTVPNLTGGSGGGGGATQMPAPAPAVAPAPLAATTNPQPEGDNPHGQGSVLEVMVPLIDQDVIVGKSRGEQDANGEYHGKVTVVSALGLEAAIETDEGEEAESPLGPVNDILNSICTGSGNNVCLTVLDYRSETNEDGSFNSFSAATAQVGNGLVGASLLKSNGDIADDGDCQVASGGSEATAVSALGVLSANTLDSGSASAACRNGSQGATGASDLGGVAPIVALSEVLGCDSTNESTFVVNLVLVTLADGVCNGETTSQAIPFNVQKALQLDLLPELPVDLVELVAASAESLAQAPEGPDPECPDPDNPVCDEGDDILDEDQTTSKGPGPGPGGGPTASGPGADSLPFSGADLGVLLLIGGAVMATGLGLMALADRRRRRLLQIPQ